MILEKMIQVDFNYTELNNTAHLKAPGKVFLIGEYAVLLGLPSVLCAIEPYFEFIKKSDESLDLSALNSKSDGANFKLRSEIMNFKPHKESPAGKIFSPEYHENLIKIDPYGGVGGLGGSTAEFIALSMWSGERDLKKIFELYLELHKERKVKPSGADLISQFSGGVTKVIVKENDFEVTSLSREMIDMPFILFQTSHLENRKTKTHEHLEDLRFESLLRAKEKFKKIIDSFLVALIARNLKNLGMELNKYATLLSGLGLEHEACKKDREDFLKISGVFGVKGCGALQSDAMIVLVRDEDVKNKVLELGRKKNFKILSEKIIISKGAGYVSSANL